MRGGPDRRPVEPTNRLNRPPGIDRPRPGTDWSISRARALTICSARPAAVATHPFGDHLRVYKVSGKMFAAVTLRDSPCQITLKCEPLYGAALVNHYEAIAPGFHMNKRHWITVTLSPALPSHLLEELVGESYGLVRSGNQSSPKSPPKTALGR